MIDRAASRLSFSTTFPNIPPCWAMPGGNSKDAVHSSFSEDEYHGIGFSWMAHEAVAFSPGPRTGSVSVEYGLIIVAYGVPEHTSMTLTFVGIIALPALITVTSTHVRSPSSPSLLNETLSIRGSVDSDILILTTRSVEYCGSAPSAGFLICRKMSHPSPGARFVLSGMVTQMMIDPPWPSRCPPPSYGVDDSRSHAESQLSFVARGPVPSSIRMHMPLPSPSWSMLIPHCTSG